MMRISDEAREKSADLRSKSYDLSVSGRELGGRCGGRPNLILASFSAVGALDVHDHEVHALGSAHPDAFRRLLSLGFVHDIKSCAK
jgi:hypothetical protein